MCGYRSFSPATTAYAAIAIGYNLHVVGRLRDGVSIERAQARMDQITASLAAETPRWFTDRVARVEPLHEFVTRGVRTWMIMLLAAVSFVLLIACVNLANLMLVRATARSRELGIRAALGGSRWDLSRVLLLESLILVSDGSGAWCRRGLVGRRSPAIDHSGRGAPRGHHCRRSAGPCDHGDPGCPDGRRVRHGAGREVLASDRRRCCSIRPSARAPQAFAPRFFARPSWSPRSRSPSFFSLDRGCSSPASLE